MELLIYHFLKASRQGAKAQRKEAEISDLPFAFSPIFFAPSRLGERFLTH